VQVHIELLRHRDQVQNVLEDDGWSLRRQSEGTVWARHPGVRTEAAARVRLHHLGLLVSSWLRVEFRRPGS
jgi:hypothetical protein